MKLIRWIISLLIFGLAFWWASRIHSYYFGLTQADLLGLMLMSIVGILFFQKFNFQFSSIRAFLICILFVALLFNLYSAISDLILFSDLSWLIVYLFLVVTVFCINYLFQSNLLFLPLLALIVVFLMPYEFKEEQYRFFDRVESSIETREGHAQVVRWKKDSWLYYNDQLQFSTMDRHMYQEAYVQPVMQLLPKGSSVLLVGGDNGVVEEELSEFQPDISLTTLTIDLEFYNFSRSADLSIIHEFDDKKVISKSDAFEFLSQNESQFDLIIVDVPDPVNLDFDQYYTVEFYKLANKALSEAGFLVSQTGDFYKNGNKARQTWNSVKKAGMNILPLQCQIPTIGQWTWVIGSKGQQTSEMKEKLARISPTESIWWNQDAANLMMSFGKDYFSKKTDELNYLVETNQVVTP